MLMKTHFKHFLWILLLYCAACSKEEGVGTTALNDAESPQDSYEALLIDPQNNELTEVDAMQVSSLFMQRDTPLAATRAAFKNKAAKETFSIKGDDGEVLAYVVNFEGGGYNIISATKKYFPILAFSDQGAIREEALQGNGLAFWVECITEDIAEKEATLAEGTPEYIEMRSQWWDYEKRDTPSFSTTVQNGYYWYLQLRYSLMSLCGDARTNRQDYYAMAQNYGSYGLSSNEAVYKEIDRVLQAQYSGTSAPPALVWGEGMTTQNTVKIMPLLRTYWDQIEPYSNENEIRDSGKGHKLAGCVTIAVAQIMNYYCYPSVVDNVPIDWTLTQEEAPHQESTNTEIPKLVRVVNVGVKTINGDSDSPAFTSDAQDFLRRNGYMANIYSSDIDIIAKNEIMASRPIYMSGGLPDVDKGHAWVCDGFYSEDVGRRMMAYEITNTQNKHFPQTPYRSLMDKSRMTSWNVYYHMNWGWGIDAADYSDPSDISNNTIGWYRSPYQTDYPRRMQVMQVVPNNY